MDRRKYCKKKINIIKNKRDGHTEEKNNWTKISKTNKSLN